MAACGKFCDRDKSIELAAGQVVCSYCPEWMIECEAMENLKRPLERRRWHLRDIEKARGIKSADILRARMVEIYDIWKKSR